MRRLTFVAAMAASISLLTAPPALAPPRNSDELLKDELHRLQQSQTLFRGGQKGGQAQGIEVVGHNDIGGRGFNADVWAHEGFAYVGQWGFTDWAQGSKQRFCPKAPDSGVAVIDYGTDPSNPVEVSRLQNPPGTSAEDVVVYEAPFGPLAGRDIAAVGIQVCGGSRLNPNFPRGLQLFDVTDPATPVPLGFLHTGCWAHGDCTSSRWSIGTTWAGRSPTRPSRPASTPNPPRRAASGTRPAAGTSG